MSPSTVHDDERVALRSWLELARGDLAESASAWSHELRPDSQGWLHCADKMLRLVEELSVTVSDLSGRTEDAVAFCEPQEVWQDQAHAFRNASVWALAESRQNALANGVIAAGLAQYAKALRPRRELMSQLSSLIQHDLQALPPVSWAPLPGFPHQLDGYRFVRDAMEDWSGLRSQLLEIESGRGADEASSQRASGALQIVNEGCQGWPVAVDRLAREIEHLRKSVSGRELVDIRALDSPLAATPPPIPAAAGASHPADSAPADRERRRETVDASPATAAKRDPSPAPTASQPDPATDPPVKRTADSPSEQQSHWARRLREAGGDGPRIADDLEAQGFSTNSALAHLIATEGQPSSPIREILEQMLQSAGIQILNQAYLVGRRLDDVGDLVRAVDAKHSERFQAGEIVGVEVEGYAIRTGQRWRTIRQADVTIARN